MDLVKIKAFDGAIIQVPKQLIYTSECLKSLLELLCDNEEECIPLLHWTTIGEIVCLMNDWWNNKKFDQVETEKLVQLAIAANYLIIPALEDFCLQLLLSRIMTDENRDWFPLAFEQTKISERMNYGTIKKLRNDYPHLDDLEIPCEFDQRLCAIVGKSKISYREIENTNVLDDTKLLDKDITSLKGIEVFSNLKAIHFQNSMILDPKPLTLLKNLSHVHLNWCIPCSSLMEIENLRHLSINNDNHYEVKHLFEDLSQFSCCKFTSFAKDLTSLTLQSVNISDLNIFKNPPPNLQVLGMPRNLIKTDLDELRHIKGLTKLDLSENLLKNIDVLQYLTNLVTLNLKQNLLENIEPLQHLHRLEQLDLSVNAIKSLEPLKNLHSLTHLNAYSVKIKDISPLKNLHNLTDLNLRSNNIYDIKVLRNLHKLTYLDLSDNKISDIKALKNLHKLTQLILKDNSIESLEPLKYLQNLTHLYITTKVVLEPLKHLQNLTHLYISGVSAFVEYFPKMLNTIYLDQNKMDITPLKYLKKLQNLTIIYCNIDNLKALKDLKKLENLNMHHNKITNLEPLKNLQNLKNLDLRFNKINDLEPLRNLLNLNELNISYNIIENLVPLQNLLNMNKLNVSFNKIYDLEPLKNMLNLKNLDVRFNRIKEVDPLKNMYSLNYLNISCNEIEDIEPLKNLHNLNKLLIGNTRIRNVEVVNLAVLITRCEEFQTCRPLFDVPNLWIPH